nr:hypothetical protein [Tanacetum cinerariifolium]
MYCSRVSASLAWSSQIHQRPPYKPMYPEYIPLEDEHVLSAEEQPLPPVVLPTVESPEYVAESDPEEDPKEYEDDETEDGPVDSPMDGGDDGDDYNGESSGDDADDEDEDEEDEEGEEEEEHFVSADSAIIIPTDELTAVSLPPEAKVERLLAMPTPPPSPLASLSPPSAGERLARCTAPSACPSPPHMPSPLLPSSGCPTQIQTLKMASTQALIDAVTATIPSPPLPPPLYIPPPVNCKDDIPEIEMPPRKRLRFSTLGSRYEIRESSTARPTRDRRIDYRDTWVDPTETVPEIAPMTMREVNTRVTKLVELHEHDTRDLYALLEDAQDSRTRISQRVVMDSQRVNLLMEDRIAHQETILIVKEEAYAAREAWAYSIGLSQAVYFELQTHREQVQGPNVPPNNTNPNNMTPESVQAMIDQALLRNSTNGDGSHSSHEDNRRNVQTARPCFYADFMKCQPLNFKGTEGVVGLTRCIEKM